jgi:hypothetical protein
VNDVASVDGSVAPPICQTSTLAFATSEEGAARVDSLPTSGA